MGKQFTKDVKRKPQKRGKEEGGGLDAIFDELAESAPLPYVAPIRQRIAVPSISPRPVVPYRPRPEGHRVSDTKCIHTSMFQGDGKIFYLDAVKNERGMALRIAEVSKGKRTIIMVPFSLLVSFETAQAEVLPHFKP